MKGLRFAFKSSTGVKVLADPHHERNNGIVPKSRKEALENDNRPHNTEKSTTAASDLLRDTLVGHSCRTLLWDTLVGHSCETLL